MTVEEKSEKTQIAEEAVSQQEGPSAEEGGAEMKEVEEPEKGEDESKAAMESNLLSDLKENEKKALFELRAKVEEAILENKLFKRGEEKVEKKEEAKKKHTEEGEREKPDTENVEATEEEGKKEKSTAPEEKETTNEEEEKEKPSQQGHDREKSDAEKQKFDVGIEEKEVEINRDISIWGVPLLPSKGSESTDVVLLKFLHAREFKVIEAFEMLKNTLRWRMEFRMDSILDEVFGFDLNSVAYMNGVDRDGHPVCYNMYGVFEDKNLFEKTFETVEKNEQFLRWRLQVMEKCIQKLSFNPGGISSILQINDLKNAPGPSKKEHRMAIKQAIALLQDNYPEFVARNIFINVSFCYYAFNVLLSPFLTQRTKSKFVFARPAKVTEILLKYIAAKDIPVYYGGFKRENDTEFSGEDGGVSELSIKSGSTATVVIPAPEVGNTLLWDLTVLGWEVNYKEEFVPTDEGSYTIIIQKSRKMSPNEPPIRNSFRNNEPGKVVLTIGNNTFKKKRVLYRYKVKSSS